MTAVLAAGCSDGTNARAASSDSATTGTRKALWACGLVTQADATQLFGRAAQMTTVNHPTGAVSVCGWKADSMSDPTALGNIGYKVEAYAYDGAQYYVESSLARPERLTGIGDRAFIVVGSAVIQGQAEWHGHVASVTYSVTAPYERARQSLVGAQKRLFIALLRTAAARL